MTHLQSVLLMILSDIDELLRTNGVPYYIIGGTALGAIRHKGFIPWDDDVDLGVLPEYWEKLDYVLRNKLDKKKYSYEQAYVDTVQQMSKIKLNNTHIHEVGAIPEENDGIYIDIFRYDNARRTKVGKYFQFLCGRGMISYILSNKPYETTSIAKKIAIGMSRICRIPFIHKFIYSQVLNQPKSEEICMVLDRTRGNWKKYFYPRRLFSGSKLVEFEGRKFPVCNGIEECLTLEYGDYMKLPPVEQRVGLHILSVDFGEY